MLFSPEGEFIPEAEPNLPIQRALLSLNEAATVPILPRDLLFHALRTATPALTTILGESLQPGQSVGELPFALNNAKEGIPTKKTLRRQLADFTPAAQACLADFERAKDAAGNSGAGLALEMLVMCIIPHLDSNNAGMFSAVDFEQFQAKLRGRIVLGIASVSFGALLQEAMNSPETAFENPQPTADNSKPLLIPQELAPSDDLTMRLSRTEFEQGALEGSPFDGEPAYDSLFGRLQRALYGRTARHVLLVGERGVGQSTIFMELARRALKGNVPYLREKRFVTIDGRHTAGDESRQRLQAILSHLAGHSEAIACLDGFGSLLRSERGSNKAALLSVLTRSRCQIVGLLSPREYEELVAEDADMLEFFTRVNVIEPEPIVAQKLVRQFANGLERRFRVTIEDEAIRQAVWLSANYILHERLPAKAVRILHQICEDLDYERSQHASARDHITSEDVVALVSQLSGVPEETLRGIAEKSDYVRSLSTEIVGQAQAVREVATELGLIKAGLTDANKPASVMLFVGQTGTGKTEMAKALARFYSTSKRLRTYTLGNFIEPHSVASIIGVPPGYVGHDQGGRLIGDLNTDPYCVFLLDEADKAHPDVLQPFLNLFDEGWIRDQRGVQGFANKSIFILTTNVGQRMIADMAKQGKTPDEMAARMKEALAQIKHGKSNRPVFAPEFLARIKRVIVFQPLDRAAMEGICRKLVTDAQRLWQENRQKKLEVPEELIVAIAEEAHRLNEKSEGREGGRIVRKLIADWIDACIQRESSDHPSEYRSCHTVAIKAELLPAAETGAPRAPQVSVVFRSGGEI